MRTIIRYIVSLIFIASGFVKAIDLKGFSFKMEEYFSPVVFNLPFLEQFALAFAIIVVVLELVLGFMLLMKIKLKFSIYTLIVLCVFFGFLTFYSAFYNVVTDCGCFGDAIKFTPWQSFWKDIILLLGLIVLAFLYRKSEEDDAISKMKLPVLAVFILVMLFVMYRGIAHEPLIDFRAYKIGTDIAKEKQNIKANPSEYKTFYVINNSKTGESKKVNQDEYINDNYWKDSNWAIDEIKTTSEIVKQGYESEIVKFKIEDETGTDVTDQIIQEPKVIIIFTYKPKEADLELLAKTVAKALAQDVKVIGVSTQPSFYKNIPSYMMDEVATKTIARSNPFVLVLKNGKVVEKLGANDYLK